MVIFIFWVSKCPKWCIQKPFFHPALCSEYIQITMKSIWSKILLRLFWQILCCDHGNEKYHFHWKMLVKNILRFKVNILPHFEVNTSLQPFDMTLFVTLPFSNSSCNLNVIFLTLLQCWLFCIAHCAALESKVKWLKLVLQPIIVKI